MSCRFAVTKSPHGVNRAVDEDGFLAHFGCLTDGATGKVFDRSDIKSLIDDKKIALEKRTSRGDFVLFNMSNHAEFFVTLFSCWELGLIPVITPPRSSALEIENVRTFFQASAVFKDEKVEFYSTTSLLAFNPPPGIRETTALVLLTSGTLGEPKSIFLSFTALKEKFAALAEAIPLEERRNAMCFLPLCFGHGLICNSLFPLLSGSTLFIYPSFELQLAATYLEAVKKYRIDFFSTVPVILKILMQQRLPSHELRRVHCASAPLMINDWKAADRWLGNGLSVTHVYGLTEFSGWVAGSRSIDHRAPGYVGKPWGVDIQVREENNPGEILLRGAGCMSGFVDHGKFHAVDRTAWFATGDLGRTDERGSLTLMGRQKDIINYGGFKVHPEDIDSLLAQHPQVQEVCCFAIESDNLGEVPAVALVLKGAITEKELKAWCAERIHAHKIPVRWFFVDRLPKTERGKISRHQVRQSCQSPQNKLVE